MSDEGRGSILGSREADLEALADEIGGAFEEARDAYNNARALGVEVVTVSRRNLYLLTVAAAHAFNIGVHDASQLQ